MNIEIKELKNKDGSEISTMESSELAKALINMLESKGVKTSDKADVVEEIVLYQLQDFNGAELTSSQARPFIPKVRRIITKSGYKGKVKLKT